MAILNVSASWPMYAGICLVSWLGFVVISRRFFHPLSKVPGPFLWSVSSLPILYHQGFREGKLLYVLPELHKIYGPIVRIGPNEVHLVDPENYDKIYNMTTKFYKDPAYYGPMEDSMKTPILLTVISNEGHRIRRAPLDPFFSRRSVLSLENVVWTKVRKLCGMIQDSFDSHADEPFDAHNALRAMSVDIITEYSYGQCWNQLDEKGLGSWYQEAIRAIQVMFVYFQTFPFLIPIFGLIPDSVNVIMFPPFKKWFDSLEVIRQAVKEVRKSIEMEIKPERRTIFHELIDPPPINTRGKSPEPLSDLTIFADAVNVTGAGAETTGAVAERAMFDVLSHPAVYKRLTTELRQAFPNAEDMSLVALEKLPYLSAVIKEALRLNPGVPGHLPRIVPQGGITFNGHYLPAGSTVSMTAFVMHRNTEAFPDPETFDPERWLGPPDEVRKRERSFVPFSRGSRNCIGQNLAMCELHCALGTIFHRFDDLAVHPEFGVEDLEMVELLIGYHPKNARKFKILRNSGGD